MNKISTTLIAMLLLASTATMFACPPGPKGGKMLHHEPQRAEFYVDDNRKIVVTFYNADLKPVAVTEEGGVVWAEAKRGRVKLALEKKGDVLVSSQSLPEGDGYSVRVQLKSKPDAKLQSFEIAYHDEICPKCKRAEYACACEDASNESKGIE